MHLCIKELFFCLKSLPLTFPQVRDSDALSTPGSVPGLHLTGVCGHCTWLIRGAQWLLDVELVFSAVSTQDGYSYGETGIVWRATDVQKYLWKAQAITPAMETPVGLYVIDIMALLTWHCWSSFTSFTWQHSQSGSTQLFAEIPPPKTSQNTTTLLGNLRVNQNEEYSG